MNDNATMLKGPNDSQERGNRRGKEQLEMQIPLLVLVEEEGHVLC